MSRSHHLNRSCDLTISRGIALEGRNVIEAVERCNSLAQQLHSLPVDLFELLGMRNLSSFVGELFAASLREVTGNLFQKNPHQDGYPDLLLMDRTGIELWNSLQGQLRDKGPFSPFLTGGVEIKATCGSVPTDAKCRKLGHEGKPRIGEQRIGLVNGYDWKAHHRETNHLMGIFWDFIDRVPKVIAVFYCNTLSQDHWGEIVQPKEGGGRTTSVSIMTRDGVKKMYSHWVCVIKDDRYTNFFNTRNGAALMPPSDSAPRNVHYRL
jgi:hypothetical protein